ncbi:MAG: hypothetical protein QXK21_00175 [Candidatus Micrarchaeia archaeon]
MAKQITTFVLLLLISSLAFAFWYESINVTVYSKDGLPMKNVPVTVIYQSSKCGEHSELTKKTNESGMVSFSFMNTVDESFGKCIERIYTIRADFGGYSNSTIGDVNKTNKNYQLWLPFISHIVSVRNAVNNTIQGANVTAFNVTYTTDAGGNAFILLPAAMLSDFTVQYGSVSTKTSVNPSLKQVTYVSLPIYDLKVSLTDENGNSLYGKIRYGEEEKLLENSYVVFKSFSDLKPTFYVTVNNVTKQISTIISSDNIILRYDMTPPIIKDIETRVTNNRVYISAVIVDGGKYASGISSNPILSYTSNTSQSQGQKMFFVGNNRYETSIPLEGNNEINYTIIAIDSQGNSAKYSDVYYASFKIEKEIEKATKGFSWLTFIGIFAFAVIIYVIYTKIKEQAQ